MPPDLPPDKSAARRIIRSARAERRAAATEQVWRDVADDLATGFAHWLTGRDHRPETVAVYEALPTEPPTATLLAALGAAGTRLLVPELLVDKDLAWREVATGEHLGREAIAEAEVILVPALAVALDGLRLGQGGGSYDRALARRPSYSRVVGVVFEDELVDAVPSEPHDQRVDAVLTPSRGVRDLKY